MPPTVTPKTFKAPKTPILDAITFVMPMPTSLMAGVMAAFT